MNLSELKAGVATLLEARNYSTLGTLKHHEWFCRAVGRFLQDRYGNQEYTAERGEEFMKFKYGFNPKRLEGPLSHYQRFLLRMLDRLDTFLDEARLAELRKKLLPTAKLEGEFEEALEGYLQFMCEIQN